jgi:hypothetical protein
VHDIDEWRPLVLDAIGAERGGTIGSAFFAAMTVEGLRKRSPVIARESGQSSTPSAFGQTQTPVITGSSAFADDDGGEVEIKLASLRKRAIQYPRRFRTSAVPHRIDTAYWMPAFAGMTAEG